MCLITGSLCHSPARRYQWFRRISPQKCSVSVSSAGAGSNSKRTLCSSSCVGSSSGRKRRKYSISTNACFCSSKNHTLMNAEKSESCRLSRRNISVAGSADHSVMEFILIVCACSSDSSVASNACHGTSCSMFQRTASRDLNSSGYSIDIGERPSGGGVPLQPARQSANKSANRSANRSANKSKFLIRLLPNRKPQSTLAGSALTARCARDKARRIDLPESLGKDIFDRCRAREALKNYCAAQLAASAPHCTTLYRSGARRQFELARYVFQSFPSRRQGLPP